MKKTTFREEWLFNVRADILAGIVVALALIPEALAFSIIAGVDPKDFNYNLSATFTRPGIITPFTDFNAALGATRETVVEDYRATDRIWRRDHSLPEGTPAGLANALLSTHPELLEETLDRAIAAHGGLDGLLERGLGLDAPRLAALRAAYLD